MSRRRARTGPGPRRRAPGLRRLLAPRAPGLRRLLAPRALFGLLGPLAVLLSGCGVPTTGPEPAGAPAVGANRPGTASRDARLLFVGPYGLRYAARTASTPVGPQEAVDLLLEGPTAAERERGLVTLVPPMKGEVTAVRTTPDTVDLHLPVAVQRLEQAAVSQLACTAAKAADLDQTKVLVRVHEPDTAGTWDLRCDASGSAYPAEAPAPTA
ncbi:hypothetical protein [Streptomyces sp. NPDC048659]|uniref:hypothetical protein n=1 Tax=Streptomyces sp. NPDC048659 TaxID=3155489 RepID=UPI0034126196